MFIEVAYLLCGIEAAARVDGVCIKMCNVKISWRATFSQETVEDEIGRIIQREAGQHLARLHCPLCPPAGPAGDKLLPSLLSCLSDGVGSVLDNPDRAARLGWLTQPSKVWIAARALRNRMVHEYIRDPALLAAAVTVAH